MRGFSIFALALLVASSPRAVSSEDLADFLYLKFGDMRAGSGIGGGLEFRNDHFANGEIDLRIESKISIRLYQQHEIEVIQPHLFSPRFFIEFLALYRSYTQVDFFGIGPESREEDHSDFRVDGLGMFVNFGVRPARRLQVGIRSGYLRNDVGPGTDDDLPSVTSRFGSAELPGLVDEPDHFLLGGFLAFDFRDDVDDPSSGAYYELQSTRYEDVAYSQYAFFDVDWDVRHFFPLSEKYILALRARGVFTGTGEGQQVPFYLLPALGGSESLHAFENDRFRDRHMLFLNNEVRYRASPTIRIEAFVDAGEVFPRLGAFRLGGLELSYGAGVRYKAGRSILMGLAIGFGREGARISYKGDFRF